LWRDQRKRKGTNLKRRRMETCWRRLVMTLLCGISLFVSKTEAIKFSAEGVSVPDGVLRVDQATELECNYIKWVQESLASVTWSIQYSGVKTDFFVYKPTNKEVKPGMSMLSVDATNSEDKVVNMRLTDGQEREVVICCDVKVLRDQGYGSMTTKHKEKCSAPIRVEQTRRLLPTRRPPYISADVPESGTVGETVQLVCNAGNHESWHSLRLMVNGETLRNIRAHTVQYSLPLRQTHFTSSSSRYGQEEAVVSCLIMERGSPIANDTRIIRKEDSDILAPLHEAPGGGNSRPTRFPTQPRMYLVLEETYSGGSRLLGSVDIEGIPNPSRTAPNVLETSLSPVELLDILGLSGHRVVGVASKHNLMVWTLEREDDHREL
jgi:hypothetical protein